MRAIKAQVLAVAAAALLPLGAAGPAHAADYIVREADGCRIEVWGLLAKSPNGREQEYKAQFTCRGNPNREVVYRVDLREADRGKFGDVGGDNTVYRRGRWLKAKATPELSLGPYLLRTTKSHDAAGDKRGEFYQRVCYRVMPAGATSSVERCVNGPTTVVRVS